MRITHDHPTLPAEGRHQLLTQLYSGCVTTLRHEEGYCNHRGVPPAVNMRGR